MGIVRALGADGTVRSISPATGRPLEVTFRQCCANVVEEWCPQVNFFEDQQTARAWLRSKRQVAEVVPISEASRRGAAAWGGS